MGQRDGVWTTVEFFDAMDSLEESRIDEPVHFPLDESRHYWGIEYVTC